MSNHGDDCCPDCGRQYPPDGDGLLHAPDCEQWRLTRAEQKTDTVYVCPSGQAFVTPDGVGRYWYDDEEEAHALHDNGPGHPFRTEYLQLEPEDW